MSYAEALAVQIATHQRVIDHAGPPTLLLVEHDPVITVSQRKASQSHLVASPQQLAKLGIDVQPTDRGGDITYHGPGQLVAYPIVRLSDYGLNVGTYVRLLEQVVIETLAALTVIGFREPPNTGVWVMPAAISSAAAPAKIAAIGVRVKRNVTLHGLALNVTTDLSHFQAIVPCGLVGRSVTSLASLMSDHVPGMDRVKAAFVDAMRVALESRVTV